MNQEILEISKLAKESNIVKKSKYHHEIRLMLLRDAIKKLRKIRDFEFKFRFNVPCVMVVYEDVCFYIYADWYFKTDSAYVRLLEHPDTNSNQIVNMNESEPVIDLAISKFIAGKTDLTITEKALYQKILSLMVYNNVSKKSIEKILHKIIGDKNGKSW